MNSVTLLAAVSRNNIIGHKGKLPWFLLSDLMFFRRMTLNGVVLIGKQTLSEIPKGLPGRTCCVLTRGPYKAVEGSGQTIPVGLDNALYTARQVALNEKVGVFVCGGAFVYDQFMDMCDEAIITRVRADVVGDTRMPDKFYDLFEKYNEVPVCPHSKDEHRSTREFWRRL